MGFMKKNKKSSDTTIRISREVHSLLEKESLRQKISIKQLIANLVIQNYRKDELEKDDYETFMEGIPNIEFKINRANFRDIAKKINIILSRAREAYIKMSLYVDTVDAVATMDMAGFLNKNKLSKVHYYKKRSVIIYSGHIMLQLKNEIKDSKLRLLKSFLNKRALYLKKKFKSPSSSFLEDDSILRKSAVGDGIVDEEKLLFFIFSPSDKVLEEMRAELNLAGTELSHIRNCFELQEINEEEILEKMIAAFIFTNYKVCLEIVPACFGNKLYPLSDFIDCL